PSCRAWFRTSRFCSIPWFAREPLFRVYTLRFHLRIMTLKIVVKDSLKYIGQRALRHLAGEKIFDSPEFVRNALIGSEAHFDNNIFGPRRRGIFHRTCWGLGFLNRSSRVHPLICTVRV